jgi:hypothetical protein
MNVYIDLKKDKYGQDIDYLEVFKYVKCIQRVIIQNVIETKYENDKVIITYRKKGGRDRLKEVFDIKDIKNMVCN